MNLNIVKGNLITLALEGHFNIIVHGCNCFCTMNSGVAKQIKDIFPDAYYEDLKTERGDHSKLGSYSVLLGKRFNIINAYTQYYYGRDGKDYFEYEAFQNILDSLAKEYPNCSFGFPAIGMGLAGGSRERITAMLEAFADKILYTGGVVTLVEYELDN